MKKIHLKHIMSFLFLFVIFTPLILGGIYFLFGIRFDTSLSNDNSAHINMPVLSASAFLDGSFQTQFEKYFNIKFPPRNSLVKTYNQLSFLLFGETKNLAIRDNYIYEKSYLEDYAGRSYNPSDPKVKKELDDYIDALEQISQKLKKKGKKLIVYSAPNKCDYTEEHIPRKYQKAKLRNNNSLTSLEYFNQNIDSNQVTYIDFRPILDSLQYPIFYKNGIHWSRPAEQKVSQAVIRAINDFYGNVKPLEFTGIRRSQSQISREEDIAKIANLWFFNRETYYEFKTKSFEETSFQKPVIFIQGDSFAEGLFTDISQNKITDTCYLAFRDNLIRDIQNKVIADTRKFKQEGITIWDAPQLPDLIEESDVICIEFCSSIMNLRSFGFIDYLNKMLGEIS